MDVRLRKCWEIRVAGGVEPRPYAEIRKFQGKNGAEAI